METLHLRLARSRSIPICGSRRTLFHLTRIRLRAGLRVSHGWAGVRTSDKFGRYSSARRTGCASKGTPSRYTGSSCSLGFDGDKFVAQWFGLPFEFCFQPFLPLGVSGGPQGLVILDLIFDHGVKHHCDLVGGCHGGSLGAQLGFHAALRIYSVPSE